MSNAVLLDVRAPGAGVDRHGDVTAAGTATWTGHVSAYLRRERRRTVSGGVMTNVELDVLFVHRPASSLASVVTPSPGDQATGTTVLIEDRRSRTPVTRRFRVVGVELSAIRGNADGLRLELDDERPA